MVLPYYLNLIPIIGILSEKIVSIFLGWGFQVGNCGFSVADGFEYAIVYGMGVP